jgi:hypothetical protein
MFPCILLQVLPSAALRQEGLSVIGNSATYIESARKGLQVKVVREYVRTVFFFFLRVTFATQYFT